MSCYFDQVSAFVLVFNCALSLCRTRVLPCCSLSHYPPSLTISNFMWNCGLSAIRCMVRVLWYNPKDAFTPQMKCIFLILFCWLRKRDYERGHFKARASSSLHKKQAIFMQQNTHSHNPASFSLPSPGLWKYTHWLSTCRITHAHILKKVQLWNKNLQQWGALLRGRA